MIFWLHIFISFVIVRALKEKLGTWMTKVPNLEQTSVSMYISILEGVPSTLGIQYGDQKSKMAATDMVNLNVFLLFCS